MSHEDRLIAEHEEEEIERFVVEHCYRDYLDAEISPEERALLDAEIPSEVCALRRIDQLQSNGTYEEERERLRAEVAAENAAPHIPNPKLDRLTEKLEASMAEALKEFPDFRQFVDEKIRNLWRGLESPDPSQRARFKTLVEKERLNERPILDFWHILRVLEPAQRSSGRPAKPSNRKDADLLRIMRRKCCREGVSIPKAAKQVARLVKEHGVESVAKRLEMKYRKKMKLREWPPVRPGKIIVG